MHNNCCIQYNLDYPEYSGADKNIRLIESSDNRIPDNRVYTRKLICYNMYSYLYDVYLLMTLIIFTNFTNK